MIESQYLALFSLFFGSLPLNPLSNKTTLADKFRQRRSKKNKGKKKEWFLLSSKQNPKWDIVGCQVVLVNMLKGKENCYIAVEKPLSVWMVGRNCPWFSHFPTIFLSLSFSAIVALVDVSLSNLNIWLFVSSSISFHLISR